MHWTLAIFMILTILGCKQDTNSSATPTPAIAAVAQKNAKGECDDVDDTKLDAVVECFYRTKRSASQWRFYSNASKAETSEAEVAEEDRSNEWSDVRITKQDTMGGNSFAAVSRIRRDKQAGGGTGCSTTGTRTWIKEGQAWRLHGGAAQAIELAEKKFQAGDYSGAAESAEEWLKIDPFSIDAYRELGFAVMRGAKGKSANDIVRGVLGVNAKDSSALNLAISMTSDIDVMETYLRQFKPDDCSLPTAVANVASTMIDSGRPRDGLSLLDKHSALDELGFPLQRIFALHKLRRAKEVPGLLTETIVVGIKKELDSADSRYAARWAANIAAALIDAREKDKAREWIDYGLVRDPSLADLAKLLRALRK